MRFPMIASVQALVRPARAFQEAIPPLGKAALGMALVWMPPALVNAGITFHQGLQAYESLRHGWVPPAAVLDWFGMDPGGLQQLLLSLPPPPAWGSVWPWLMLAVPVGVMGTWLHHAVWDHTGLWLLGGLQAKRGFRITLVAEAEALRTTAVGTLLGLLAFLPGLGWLLAPPLLLLDVYCWLFRGFALAARHGCQPWKGVLATVLHAVLLGCCALGLLGLASFLARFST